MAEKIQQVNENSGNAAGIKLETFVFKFQVNPSRYAERFGLKLPDDTADATLADMDHVDEETVAEDAASVSYGARAMSYGAPGCKATLAQCQAKNPMTCRFHGALAISQDIEEQVKAAFQAQGQQFAGNVDVKIDNVTGGILTCTARVTGTKQDKKMIQAAMKAFFKLPGVDGDETDMYKEPSGFDTPFDIDMLDPNAKARWGNGAAPVQQVTTTPAQATAPTSPTPSPVAQTTQSSQTASPQTQGTTSVQQQASSLQTSVTTQQPATATAQSTQVTNASKPTVATPAQAPTVKKQKTLRGISKIAADKKDLASLRAAGGDQKVCDDIEALIDEKEKAISSMDSIDKTLKQAPSSLLAGYQKVRDALFNKIKDLSDKIDDGIDREEATVQAKSAGTIAVGDSAATVKNKLMALKKAGKIKFVPKMLDHIDKCVEAQLNDIRMALENDMPEISNDATWTQLQDLVSKSLSGYLDKCAFRTYCGANTIMTHFLATSTYNPSTSMSFNKSYYGVTDIGERGTCCSSTIPDHDPFDSSIQSGWDQWKTDRACVTWKKDNSAITYSCSNLGSACRGSRSGENGSLITSPSITSLGSRLGRWGGTDTNLVSWFRDLLRTGQPDAGLDRAKARKVLSGNEDHDECHVFMGNAKNGEHLKHVEAFEFVRQSDAHAAVQQYGKILKDNGVKVLWGANRTEVPNP